MITGDLADVGVEDLVAGCDDEHAALLPRITLGRTLAIPVLEGAPCVPDELGRKGRAEIATQACRTICGEGGIDEDAGVEGEVFAERARKVRAAVADDDEVRATRAYLVQMFLQLVDLLAAEEASEVTNEREDDGLLFPQGAKLDRNAVLVVQSK